MFEISSDCHCGDEGANDREGTVTAEDAHQPFSSKIAQSRECVIQRPKMIAMAGMSLS
jgi:hypothetical protein